MKLSKSVILLAFLAITISLPTQGTCREDEGQSPPAGTASEKLTLGSAAMCQGIRDFAPLNRAIVFSVTIGEVFCFTFFNPVPEKIFVYHAWHFKDELITEKKLTLKPPQWSTYSSIKLRDADKGPWRVEITDEAGTLHRVLRFSITD
jgi:hypothetical protein